MSKRRLAREWLYFIGGLIVGFVLIPFLLTAIFFASEGGFFEEAMGFYTLLFSDLTWGTLLFGLTPYLLFQLVRSIVWAIKAVRS